MLFQSITDALIAKSERAGLFGTIHDGLDRVAEHQRKFELLRVETAVSPTDEATIEIRVLGFPAEKRPDVEEKIRSMGFFPRNFRPQEGDDTSPKLECTIFEAPVPTTYYDW